MALATIRSDWRKPWRRAPRHFVPNASIVPALELAESERAALHRELGAAGRILVAFFGFAYSHKGVHRLFEICDPRRHHIVLIGELHEEDPYHGELLRLAASDAWRGHVSLAGFVDPSRAARLLAAADAAVFPFVNGGGTWNSSAHAAMAQGTFTLMTSRHQSGYVAEENLYYARPEDTSEMQTALAHYAGVRAVPKANDWHAIAARHVQIYREAHARTRGGPRP